MKKTVALVAALWLALVASSALALTATGLETETVTRKWENSLFFSRMEALTGVSMQASAVTDEAEYAKLLSRMAEGQVETDVLFKASLSRAQERELLDAGALVDLAPLIDEYMPNLSALLEAHPEWREIIAQEDGRIAALPLINERERQVCVFINRAWLEQLGLDMPQTVGQLTDALKAMASGDPNGNYKADEIALDLTGVWEMRWLLPYFGVVADDYSIARVNGEAVFAPELPEYRAFVAQLAAWYEEGILSPDAFTNLHGASLYSDSTEEDETVYSGVLVSVTPYTHVTIDAITDYEPLLMPGPDGETVWRDMLGNVWTGAFAVTSACEDVEAALAWVDALYGEEGAILAYAGIEGEDYRFNDDGYWIFDVDGARTIDEIRADVLMYTGTTMPGRTPVEFLSKVDSEEDRHVLSASEKVSAVAQMVTQPYALSDSDQARADELAGVLCRMVDEGIARFVTGETPLSDETYAAWLEEMRAAGSGELAEIFNRIQ